MPSPAFQFYPSDFLSDGNQMAMSLAGAGAYIRLISVCWNEGSLPDDTKLLWKLAQADSHKQFEKVWPSVRVCFRKKRGRLIHPRLEKERAKQAAFRTKMSESGKKGAKKRRENPAPVKDNPSQAKARPKPGSSEAQALRSSASAGSLSDSNSVSKETGTSSDGKDSEGDFAALVRKHLWQSKNPPGGDWNMGRDINIRRAMVKQGEDPEVINGVVAQYQGDPVTMRIYWAKEARQQWSIGKARYLSRLPVKLPVLSAQKVGIVLEEMHTA